MNTPIYDAMTNAAHKPNIRYVAEEECRAKIGAILARFPMLATAHELNDCPCCVTWDVLHEYGQDAHDAYEELDELWFLLGEDGAA